MGCCGSNVHRTARLHNENEALLGEIPALKKEAYYLKTPSIGVKFTTDEKASLPPQVWVSQSCLRGVSLKNLLTFFTEDCGDVCFVDGLPVCMATSLARSCTQWNRANRFEIAKKKLCALAPDMHAVTKLRILPATSQDRVSMSELWNPSGLRIQVFVSHFWGENFGEFIQSTYRFALCQKHAQVGSSRKWNFRGNSDIGTSQTLTQSNTSRDDVDDNWHMDMSFYICAFSNNQWNIKGELGDSVEQSPFYKVLFASSTDRVIMNIDECATTFLRAWCIFEFCLTMELGKPFWLNTRFGPLSELVNANTASIIWVIHMFKLLADLDVTQAQASFPNDLAMIETHVARFRGSGALDGLRGAEALNMTLKSFVATRVLHALVESGDEQLVIQALELSADPNYENKYCIQPLTVAAVRYGTGHSIPEMLIKRRANPEARKGAKDVVGLFHDDFKQCQKSLERVNKLSSEVRAFHQRAIEAGMHEVFSKDARTFLEAASDGDIDRIRYLVNRNFVNVDRGDYDKRTALHVAVCEGRIDLVRCLIYEFRAAHSPLDRWGRTPLDEAIQIMDTAMVDFLETQGAQRGVQHERYLQIAAADLCYAAFYADTASLDRLTLQNKLDVNVGDYDKRTPLHLAASEGHLDTVLHLIEELGAHSNILDRWSNTPLDCARQYGHVHVVKYLEEKQLVEFGHKHTSGTSSSTHTKTSLSL